MSAPFVKILNGDVMDHLRTLPDESVHCCVTSPPYWGLRDYSRCGCAVGKSSDDVTSTLGSGGNVTGHIREPNPLCPICHGTGKIAGMERQLGLEPTPEEYISNLTQVFHEVKRVLRKDGVCFVNMGDCYGGNVTYDGTSHKAPEDYPEHDYPSPRPNGEYEATASEDDRKSRTDNQPVLGQAGDSRAPSQESTESERVHSAKMDSSRQKRTHQSSCAIQGQAPVASLEPGLFPSAQGSTRSESSRQPLGGCLHSENCAFFLPVSNSSRRDARGCVHRTDCTDGKVPLLSASALRTEDMAHSGGPCSTIVSKDYNGVAVRWPKVKPKDLVGQPWRLAFALQADGWYLRSDIIWAKPNPMPESVTDRPTKAHEYIFLLSKSPRYFYDQEAVREPNVRSWDENNGGSISTGRLDGIGAMGGMKSHPKGYPLPNPAGRNSRTVWEIATQPYPEAHFATFPEELPRRCIKAGTSEKGCCPKCGSPWERVIENPKIPSEMRNRDDSTKMSFKVTQVGGGQKIQEWRDANPPRTVGWRPTCECANEPPCHNCSHSQKEALGNRGIEMFCIKTGLYRHKRCEDYDGPASSSLEPIPCVVLDPFAGSGTTGAVARGMGRSSILIELNPEYVKLIKDRVRADHKPLEVFI